MSSSDEAGRKHWNSVAQSWNLYSSPLRPCGEDQVAFLHLANAYSTTTPGAPIAVLILGVTPEIATMAWPAGTVVTGVDKAPEMIKCAWPGDVSGTRHAHCCDWFALPRPGNPYDIAIGDGSFNTLSYPGEMRRLLVKLRTLARPGALLILRSFVRSSAAESFSDLLAAAQSGQARNFHAFKIRLAMALQASPEEGIQLNEAWQSWCRLEQAIEGLVDKNGWLPDVVRTIKLFRGKQVRLSFPTIDELIGVWEAEGVHLLDRYMPKYEMGQRCPILVGRL